MTVDGLLPVVTGFAVSGRQLMGFDQNVVESSNLDTWGEGKRKGVKKTVATDYGRMQGLAALHLKR